VAAAAAVLPVVQAVPVAEVVAVVDAVIRDRPVF